MFRPFAFFATLILIAFSQSVHPQVFDTWFTDGVMRVDLVFTGTAEESDYAFSGIRREQYYSGSRITLIDPFDYGDHQFIVKDAATGKLIFRHTYCTLFREWQTTPEADTLERAFTHVVRFPWPRMTVILEIHDRDDTGDFRCSWSCMLDPSTPYADPGNSRPFETVDLEINGSPAKKVDLLFLAEGYRQEEMDKFIADARRSADFIFSEEPFRSNRKAFNTRAVKSISIDSGTDIPGNGIWKNTILNSRFHTFGMERYMTTLDYKSVCDMASLADEYYTSAVAYNDYFNLEAEPWNPNLTTLVDFSSKWKDMVQEGTPVPTPPREQYRETVGVYEGGGYVSKGVYRPMIDCRMHSNDASFCPVCSRAIEWMIGRHTGR